MKTPRIWRKKRPGTGKLYGSYLTTVRGRDVNLRTSDANEATTRAAEAHRKRRTNFVDEIDEAAAAVEGGTQAAPVLAPPAAVESRAPIPSAVDSTPAAPRPAATAPPVHYLPPAAAGDEARAEAQATNDAAAADVGPDAAASEPPTAEIPPGVLDQLLTQAARVIVDVQLRIQGYAIGRALNVIPGEIPADSPARKLAADAWAAQLKIWIPADKMLPAWALALVLPAMCIPIQIATAQPIPDEKANDNGTEQPAADEKAAA